MVQVLQQHLDRMGGDNTEEDEKGKGHHGEIAI